MARKISDLTLDELNEKKKNIEEKLAGLRAEHDILMKSMQGKVTTLNRINEYIDEKVLTEESIKDILEYFPETKVRRKLRRELLKKWGFSANSYFVDSSQACIRISLYKDDDKWTQLAFEGISFLLPYLKPLKDGRKCFDIFEHTLSYHASYYLKITEEGDYQVVTHRDYRPPEFSSKDLMETLQYIQKNLYYEKGKSPHEIKPRT